MLEVIVLYSTTTESKIGCCHPRTQTLVWCSGNRLVNSKIYNLQIGMHIIEYQILLI